MKNNTEYRVSILKTVQTPLGFFVLVTLFIESILGFIIIKTGQNNDVIMYSMIIILFFLIMIVAMFSVKFPEALKGEVKEIKKGPQKYSIKAKVVHPPNEMNRYHQLFEGFTGSFYAFNPPFKVENTGEYLFDEAIKVHENRYKKAVRSRYLFYEPGSYERALSFFNKLKEKNPKLNIDLHVKKILCDSSIEKPGYTFFIGSKSEKPCIILYPRAVMDNGVPRAVIYIEGDENLHGILIDFFSKQWEKCNTN